MGKGRVHGKTAIITGGASGIGLAAARLLHDEGAEVVLTDIQEPPTDVTMTFLRHDISDEGAWEQVIGDVLDRFGKLDILVNCAGINGTAFNAPQNPEFLSVKQFRNVMSVNGEGTFLGCKHAIAAMKESGGSIVNVGSLSALLTMPNMFDYAASKSVVRYLTRAVALYCADKGYDIRCNLVIPGATYTPLWDTIFGDDEHRKEKEEAVRNMIPLKRWVMPEDVAYAVLYLASDEARCVTGAEILVDGGQYVKGQTTR